MCLAKRWLYCSAAYEPFPVSTDGQLLQHRIFSLPREATREGLPTYRVTNSLQEREKAALRYFQGYRTKVFERQLLLLLDLPKARTVPPARRRMNRAWRLRADQAKG